MSSSAFVAVGAGVLLIVTLWNAEWNQAATEEAAEEAKNETEDPGKSALVLSDVSDAGVATMLAGDSHGVVWPVARRVRTLIVRCRSHHNHRLLHHHGLSWLLHHWLTWLLHHWLSLRLHGLLHGHGLTLHGLTSSHGLLLHWWLLLNKRLLFGGGVDLRIHIYY